MPVRWVALFDLSPLHKILQGLEEHRFVPWFVHDLHRRLCLPPYTIKVRPVVVILQLLQGVDDRAFVQERYGAGVVVQLLVVMVV